jgi:hypothetical protein
MARVLMLLPTCGGKRAGKTTLELSVWRQDVTAVLKCFFEKMQIFSLFAFLGDIYCQKRLAGRV